MRKVDLARTLEAVANRMQVITGLTTALRRSALDDAQTLVPLEGEVDRVMRVRRTVQPKPKEQE